MARSRRASFNRSIDMSRDTGSVGSADDMSVQTDAMPTLGEESEHGLTPHQNEKIFVSVRIRPLNEKESYRNEVSDWECINKNTIIFKHSLPERSMFPAAYTYDRVFGCDAPTKDVYEEAAKEVALSVVSGINSSIFAYGQTSSGKTYTMSGVTENAVADIYDYIENHPEREFQLKFSAIEIYNEAVRDLLSTDTTPLRLLDDPERGTVVEKLTEEILEDKDHLMELLSICEAQRQIGETTLNETSSRSHQILRLTVESSARSYLGAGNSSSLTASVNFVDLAGSERASQTLSAGTRLKEGCHINRSLLTLGTVIRKLSKGKNGHVPYRDSKLTRILQNALGGNARTAIICTMSPARSHVEQSRNTLLFATCAKEVSTNAQVNVVMSDKALVKQLQKELARLESEMRSLGSAPITGNSSKLLREKELQIEMMEKEIREITRQRDVAQAWVENLLHSAGEVRLLRQSEYSAEEKSNEANYLGSKSNQQTHDNAEDNFLLDDSTPKFLGFDQCKGWEDISERNGEYENVCKEVQCIEVKNPTTNRKTEADPLSISPDKNDGNNNAVSSPRKGDKELTPTSASPEKADKGSEEYTRALQLKIHELQKTISYLVSVCPLEQSPGSSDVGSSGSRSLNLSRSLSCKPYLSNGSSPTRMEKGTSPELPTDIYPKLSDLKNGAVSRNLSRRSSDSPLSSIDSPIEDCNLEKILPPGIPKDSSRHKKLSYGSENGNLYRTCSHNFIGSDEEQNVKESGLDNTVNHGDGEMAEQKPVENSQQGAASDSSKQPVSSWPLEFEKQRKEIMELWVACNVPLVHRTYFFLLFHGDPSDSVYLEVELRRLSFLKNASTRGPRALGKTQLATPASSLKDLNRERTMLAKQIQKKLSRKDREALYEKWGIGLKTKQRSLQLTHKLWTETNDMEHINESAGLVAKLIGFVEPGQAPKEIFGLSFLSRPPVGRRSYSWKNTMSPMF